VQGTGTERLKLAMARLGEALGEHTDVLPILTLHDEVVIECDAEAALEVARWLDVTLRKAAADVLGNEELDGEDAVETTVKEAWGDG
jgi:DNA polymerase I-like protein with 3'-5' exonuclease and polymerase domains